jgi:hypothetical protein
LMVREMAISSGDSARLIRIGSRVRLRDDDGEAEISVVAPEDAEAIHVPGCRSGSPAPGFFALAHRRPDGGAGFSGKEAEDDPYRDLLAMVAGNRATAERLIAHEEWKRPGTSRPELIRNAIELIRYDQRR